MAEVHFVQAHVGARREQVGAQRLQRVGQLLRAPQARHPDGQPLRQQRSGGFGSGLRERSVRRHVAGAVTEPGVERDAGVAQQPEFHGATAGNEKASAR